MPTPAEQKALAFVAFVVLLGGAVRVMRAGAVAPVANSAEQQALARQAYAANSAAVLDRDSRSTRSRKAGRKAPRRRDAGAQFDSTGVLLEGREAFTPRGFPPPGPRIDLDLGRSTPVPRAPGRAGDREEPSSGPAALVDLDVADAGQIARLPRVGPALARRIVANRDSLGAFGVLSALGRVKGIGPATLQRLAPLVTFSGQARR